jgi:acetyltransferase-like isoleucine patch superfamily enzyme
MRVGNDVSISAFAHIWASGGVTIGDKAIFGAGSVVTMDVGEGELLAGVPAIPMSRPS